MIGLAVVVTGLVVGLVTFGLTLWALDVTTRLRWYHIGEGKRTWLPTCITLPDYHPLYRWGPYNFYLTR